MPPAMHDRAGYVVRRRRACARGGRRHDAAVLDPEVADLVASIRRIDDAAAGEAGQHGSAAMIAAEHVGDRAARRTAWRRGATRAPRGRDRTGPASWSMPGRPTDSNVRRRRSRCPARPAPPSARGASQGGGGGESAEIQSTASASPASTMRAASKRHGSCSGMARRNRCGAESRVAQAVACTTPRRRCRLRQRQAGEAGAGD